MSIKMLLQFKTVTLVMSFFNLGQTSFPTPGNTKVLTQYNDPFIKGSGKPTLGTTGATCWARGGICVHIRNCHVEHFDPGVTGCTDSYRVCCLIHKPTSPTTGLARHQPEVEVFSNNFEELDRESIETLASRNYDLLRYH